MVKRKGLFLDRDGVLNASIVRDGKPYPPRTLNEFHLLPLVPEALRQSQKLGYINIVVTNQPDLSTGKTSRQLVDQFHAKLMACAHIEKVYVCPHVDGDECNCRKPKPGMILSACDEFGLDVSKSALVGDRWRDIQSGQLARVQKIFFIDYGYQETQPQAPFETVSSLFEAVKRLSLETYV